MTRTIQALAVAAGMFAAAGCADVTAPAPAQAETVAAASAGEKSTLTFSSTTSSEGGQATSATGGAGVIDFQGSLQTGNPCYDVTGSHREQGSRVKVTVTARSTGGFCIQVITWHNYNGQVSGLSAGTYDFEIVHVVGNDSQTVYSQPVTVS